MTIDNRSELENTRLKVAELEALFETTQHGPIESEHVRELSLRSLRKRINQFKEQMAQFEAPAPGTLNE